MQLFTAGCSRSRHILLCHDNKGTFLEKGCVKYIPTGERNSVCGSDSDKPILSTASHAMERTGSQGVCKSKDKLMGHLNCHCPTRKSHLVEFTTRRIE